jgi:PAS domain-containing protein
MLADLNLEFYFEKLPIGVALLDVELNVLVLNPAFCALLGFEMPVGDTFSRFLTQYSRHEAMA